MQNHTFVGRKPFKMKLLNSFFVFILCCCTIGLSHAQTATFDVEVLQDGKQLQASAAHEIKLKRAPFVLKIRLKGIREVYCQAGFSDSMFIKPLKAAIANYKDIPAMSMAEEKFNAGRFLIIRPEGWHCWFYDPELDWHRFDKTGMMVKGNEVVALKTIDKLLIIDNAGFEQPERFERKLSEPNPAIYLFFLSAAGRDDQWYLEEELDRYALKLSWIDEP